MVSKFRSWTTGDTKVDGASVAVAVNGTIR